MVARSARAWMIAALAFSALAAGSTQAAPAQPGLRFGAAWYPEQWPRSRWDADLALMEKAHMNVVRVGEFSWSTLEPREGVYDFTWLDQAIAAAARHHIAVVLGTPTAAPPAWLTSKYPDTLRVNEDGRRAEHGNRQQFSFASHTYRRFAREIAEKMAERYGHDRRVIGWQIDNEIGPPSFDPEAKALWHRWLQAKYGTVAELNARWTTSYWSQTYDNFDEVPLHSKLENPGLLLDYKRFVSDTWRDYIDNQLQVIRSHIDKRQFVTTNTMHWNAGFNHYELHKDLDLAAWDEYVPDGRYKWLDYAVQQDLVRGYKRKNFWIMETQPAFVNWWPVNRALDKGQVRELAWQAVGHGADAVLYWQWRSALNGQEQYHGAVLGPDGEPAPVYGEIAKTGAEFAKAAPWIGGTRPHARVAMIQDYPSRWAIDFQRHHKDFDPVAEFDAFYNPLELQAQSVDVVSPQAPLDGYQLVVAPALNVLDEQEAKRLADYVRNGGVLLLGPRTGMKDAYNALNVQRQPGPLVDLLGGRVEQFYALDAPAPVSGEVGTGTASIWAETMQPRSADVQVLLRYGASNGWLDGRPAALTRRVGKGSITYLGAWLDPELMNRFIQRIAASAHVSPLLPDAGPDVEVCERSGDGRRVFVLINHGAAARRVGVPAGLRSIEGAAVQQGAVEIPAHDVVVLAGQERGA